MEPIEDELPPIAPHHAAATGTDVLEYISEVPAVSVFTRQGSALCPDLCDQLAQGRVPDGLLTDPRPGAERGTTKATTRRSGFAATTNTRTADPAGSVTDRLGRVHRCPVPPNTSRSTSAAAHASSGSTSELRGPPAQRDRPGAAHAAEAGGQGWRIQSVPARATIGPRIRAFLDRTKMRTERRPE
jgi:hypothetical protein